MSNLRKVFGNSRAAMGATRNAQAVAQASKYKKLKNLFCVQ